MITVLKTSGGLITRMLLVKIWSTHIADLSYAIYRKMQKHFKEKWEEVFRRADKTNKRVPISTC